MSIEIFFSVGINIIIGMLGVSCLAIPQDTINFLIPCIFQQSINDDNGDDITAIEQLLTRLLGGFLIAYVMYSSTLMYFGSKIFIHSHNRSTQQAENESNLNSNNHVTRQNIQRLVLSSSIYIGMSIILVLVFEMSSYEFPANSSCSNKVEVINLLVLGAFIVTSSLIGVIISFLPKENSLGIRETSDNAHNITAVDNSTSCCLCWKRILLPNSVTTNQDDDQVDVTPLLALDHCLDRDLENGTAEFTETQTIEQEAEQSLPNNVQNLSHIEGRMKGTKRLLKLAGPHSLYLFMGCLVLLVRLPFSLSIPHFVSVTLGALARSEYDEAKMNILFLFIFGTLDAALDFFCVFLFGLANLKISRGVRIELFMAILRQEIAFFDETKSGDLASRLNSDCGEMASDLTWFFRFSIESVVRICGIVLYMFLRAPRLATCAVSVVPIVAIVNKKYGDWLSKNAKDVQDALAEANSVAQEALYNIRCVLAFASEEIEEKKYHDKIDTHYNLNVKQLYATGFYYMVISTFLINTCVQALLLYVGMLLIRQIDMRPDVLLAFMLYQSQLQNEVMNLFNSYTSLVKSSGAGDKVFQLLDRTIPAPGTGCHELMTIGEESHETLHDLGGIIIKNISFAYPARPNEIVVNNLSLTIPAGKTVALIGKSGCGKSTMFALLQRFYDPSAGEIIISGANGSNLKRLNIISYRKSIGIVTQDPILFSGTIKSNIGYCAPDGTNNDEIIEAAKLANAHIFIDRFPNKYDTEVGERGVQLSGGQKQRICIARAIMSKPKLLLLDEATSALDAESEVMVQDALDRLLVQRNEMTTVIIAHRLQTIRNADKIVVMDNGRVMEEGTHEELISDEESNYYEMVQKSDRYR